MIDITTTIREAVEKLKRIPRILEDKTRLVFFDAAEEIKRIMSRPGLPVRYPIHWDSEKQRRKVIGMLQEQGNLPYQRTGQHSQGWTRNTLYAGEEVSNIGNKAVFLYGTPSGVLPSASKVLPTGQSHIHEGRWRLVRLVIVSVLSRIPKSILEKFGIHANG